VETALAQIPPDRRAQRPGRDRWSANEILEHLALVDARFSRVVGEAIAKAREAGLGKETGPRVPLGEAVVVQMRDPDVRRDAPEGVVPEGTMEGAVALRSWHEAQHRFRETLRAADGLALSQVIEEHRRWGALTPYQWGEVMAMHETRHAAQLSEVAKQLRATGNPTA